MTLQAGTRLGPYEIVSPLGAGGMGEVYRAHDAKLNRDVALKILPEVFARDADRMARFRREAQVLASLNHPNIAAIYGLEDSSTVHALVMELVEGPALAERLSGAPSTITGHTRASGNPADSSAGKTAVRTPLLPVDESLHIARQIAEALEAAHDRGIIHRDLKPANVKITAEGVVKVLDFGLAKAADDTAAPGDPSNSPTLTTPATQAGMIMGTAAYMAPEQARGQAVDRRADIWSFGVVLYEMLSGCRAFEGETTSDILASVLKFDPDWNLLPASTPPSMARLLHRCLTKNRKQRLQSIGEARIAIEETLDGGVGPGLAPALAGDEHRTPPEPALSEAKGAALRRALPWALFVLAALVAIVIGAWAWLAPRPATAPAALAYIPPPPGTSFRSFGFDAGPVVVSPGGKRLAFSATDQKGVTKIWIRALAGGEATALDETEDGSYPFWSPDGQSLGFIADEKLKTIMLSAGTIRVLADDSCPDTGGSWSSDGSILFIPQCGGPIAAISATGGTARPVVQPANEGRVVSPSFVPGGDELLYVSYESRHGSPSIRMASLTTGKSKPVMSDATAPQFASGHLLFMHEGKVFAQRFDPGNGKLKGDAVPVAEAQAYSASSNGVLAYQGGKAATRLEWFDRNGNSLGTLGSTGLWLAPKISPDGKHVLALAEDDGSADIWSYPAKTGVGSRLTFGPGYKGFAVWSPDGKYVAYVCYPAGALSLCRKPADGSGAEETLLKFAPEVASASAVDWSPDGRYLSFDQRTARPLRWSTWVLPLGGGEKPFQPAPVNENQYDGNFSLDGHWFAYFSYETGRPEVFVVPFPPSGGKFQVSQTGGWIVRWAAGDKLFFTTMGNRLMEADLATSGRSLQVQSIQPLFQLELPTTSAPLYDVMPDASRFIVATSAEPGASQSITLLLNWQAELKDK